MKTVTLSNRFYYHELGMISYRYDSYRKDVSMQAYEQEADSL